MKWFILVFSTLLYSCTNEIKNESEIKGGNENDTLEIVRTFVYGLWSLDSGNSLYNEGYYFKPDGTVDFVAAEVSGTWELSGSDSIKIEYSSFDEVYKEFLKIDSINDNRMILTNKEGSHLFRKVPFGMNSEGTVLQGFAGKAEPGQIKEYAFEVPSSKKIQLKLSTQDPEISMRVYDGTNEITSSEVKSWTAIMIRSGKYFVRVSKTESGKTPGEFDLKVISY